MKTKTYPTKEDLNELWWFRLGKVLKWTLLIAAFLAPQLLNGGWIDGLINALIWFVLCISIKKISLYIVFGKNTDTSKKEAPSIEITEADTNNSYTNLTEKDAWVGNTIAIIILIPFLVLVILGIAAIITS
jgi:hypothetical protein